jgi:hypothetical protein
MKIVSCGSTRFSVSLTMAFCGVIMLLAIVHNLPTSQAFQVPHHHPHRLGSLSTTITPLSYSQLPLTQRTNRQKCGRLSPKFMADAAASTSNGDSKISFWQKVHISGIRWF